MEVEKSTLTETDKFSTSDLKNIRNIINNLENYQLIEIIKIIDKYNYKYTQNNNGIFIDMTKLDTKIIDDIYKYLNFIKKIK